MQVRTGCDPSSDIADDVALLERGADANVLAKRDIWPYSRHAIAMGEYTALP